MPTNLPMFPPVTMLLSVGVALLLSSCGPLFDGEPGPGDERRTLAQGYTPCNDFPEPSRGVICHPSQYCSSQILSICHNGCLSQDNCSHEQFCLKTGSQRVGTCVDHATYEDRRRGEDLEPGYTACGDPDNPSRFAICHPSQYCSSDYFGQCSSGCLSEHNCTELQVCIKEAGENVGTCQHAGNR
ncbi:hypothetical protein [Lujinxingia vulgaris]|uniref:hypothetical protein n=1 Tax=Lujinxingia vulgaris TaxID=2600176 RepID=UPI001E3BE583|nr:hypothetical protein [Lujinxingia vulgaris]